MVFFPDSDFLRPTCSTIDYIFRSMYLNVSVLESKNDFFYFNSNCYFHIDFDTLS